MGWNDARDAAKGSGGGLFLRLANKGDNATVVFCGEPVVERTYWDEDAREGQGGSVVLGEGEDPPAGQKIKPRFKVNVYDVAENSMKIMELNGPTFEQVDDIMAKLGEDAFFGTKINVERKAVGLKTRYGVVPLGPMGPDEFEDMRALALHDLTRPEA